MKDVWLRSFGLTRFGRRSEDYLTLAREAAEDLVARADATVSPDHLVVASQEPGAFAEVGNVAAAVADAIGLAGIPATRIEAAPASGLAALEVAEALVQSGARRSVLVLGVEKMTGVTTEEANRVLSRMADPLERAYGLTMAAEVALMTRAYLERFGHDPSLLDDAAARAHHQGSTNRHAHFQRSFTAEEIAGTPMVADPLRRNHCAPLTDGAAAVLVDASGGPVRLVATGHATDDLALTHRPHLAATTHFAATRAAAHEAFQRAGWRAADVEVAELHDAFASMGGIHLEDLGMAPLGEGLPMVARGDTRPDGPRPMNCGGGLKARGHPVGATGIAQLVELCWQLTEDEEVRDRQARGRQHEAPKKALAHNMGGLGNNVLVALLEAAT